MSSVRHCGIRGGAGFPTALKGDIAETTIHTLIINGVECEPYITADDRLMQERAVEIVMGATLLQKMVGAEKIIFAIENDKPHALAQIKAASRKCANPN